MNPAFYSSHWALSVLSWGLSLEDAKTTWIVLALAEHVAQEGQVGPGIAVPGKSASAAAEFKAQGLLARRRPKDHST